MVQNINYYRNRGILVDTNLLILYIIGLFDRKLIGKFNRVQQFTIDDFENLCRFLDLFTKKIVTPHILTEATNLLKNINANYRYKIYNLLVKIIYDLHEFFIESHTVVKKHHFKKFGLADTAISIIGKEYNYIILTDDLPLYHYLVSKNMPAINFNHIRTYMWKLS